jgi:hypothetical protein
MCCERLLGEVLELFPQTRDVLLGCSLVADCDS